MTKNKEFTPPRDELPEYFLGRLIYFDDLSGDQMKWVVYDGRQKVRCVSRKSAEEYCRQMVAKVHPAVNEKLWRIIEHIDTAWQELDKAAQFYPVDARLELERKSLELRMIGQRVDTIQKQFKLEEPAAATATNQN